MNSEDCARQVNLIRGSFLASAARLTLDTVASEGVSKLEPLRLTKSLAAPSAGQLVDAAR